MEEQSEQHAIESYLKSHRIEECLDEIINQVVSLRPANPFVTIANSFQSKSFPEIVDVNLVSVYQQGDFGVKASLTTSIGIFSAVAKYKSPPLDFNGCPEQKEYSILVGKLKELLRSLDPTNVAQFDEAVQSINDIDTAEAMALSIACCRAGAKYKGVELFEFVAIQAGVNVDELSIPLPVPAIHMHNVSSGAGFQTIHLYPIRSTSFELALNKLNTFTCKLIQHNKLHKPTLWTRLSTPYFDNAQFEDAIKILTGILNDCEESNNLKIGINFAAEELQHSTDSVYTVGTGISKSGAEVIDQLLNLWSEVEYISVDQPVSFSDSASMKSMKKKLQDLVFTYKTTNTDKMKYSSKGIGGDNGCNLQIPLDASLLLNNPSSSDLDKLLLDFPYNIAKFQVQNFRNISQLLQVRQKISKKLPIYLDCTSYSTKHTTFDDYEADLAVGIGAVQFFGDGINSSNYCIKLERLQTIQRNHEKIPFVGGKFRVGFI